MATIHFSTQILTPVHDPAIEAQLIQHESSGTVRFDIDAGRILSQEVGVDKGVVGFRGEASSIHYLTSFTEEFISADATIAAEDLSAPAEAVGSVAARPAGPSKRLSASSPLSLQERVRVREIAADVGDLDHESPPLRPHPNPLPEGEGDCLNGLSVLGVSCPLGNLGQSAARGGKARRRHCRSCQYVEQVHAQRNGVDGGRRRADRLLRRFGSLEERRRRGRRFGVRLAGIARLGRRSDHEPDFRTATACNGDRNSDGPQIARGRRAGPYSGGGLPVQRDARLDHAALAAGRHRAGPVAVARLPRAAGHRHGGERSGRVADLLLQRPAATPADCLSRQHRRPARTDRPAGEPLPPHVAADQRSGPGRVRSGPVRRPSDQRDADSDGPGRQGQPTASSVSRWNWCWNGRKSESGGRGAAMRNRKRIFASRQSIRRPWAWRSCPRGSGRRSRSLSRPWAGAARARSAARSRRSGRCGPCRCSG